jgi:hemerythrin-like metal-binding protein
MALYDWTDDWSVGVRQMDQHHKRLFDIINKLHEEMKKGIKPEKVAAIIKELLDYTKYHFGEEEKLMERVNYTGLSAQKNAHRKFIDQIQEYKDKADQGQGVFLSASIVRTVGDWLKNHIGTMDKKYTRAMNEKGIQ